MIFKINELELKNKILEKTIILEKNEDKDKLKKEESKKEEAKNEEDKKQKEESIKQDIKKEEEEKEPEIKEKNNLNTVNEIIKEEPKNPPFKPHEIKERKIVEEPWTIVKKKHKKKKD